MFLFRSPESLVAELTSEVDFYLRFAASPNDVRNGLTHLVDEFNSWQTTECRKLDDEKADLERLKSELERLNLRPGVAVSAADRSRHDRLVNDWNRRLSDYNAKVRAYNEIKERRRRETVSSQKNMSRTWRQCQRWLNGDGATKLSMRVNRLFGRLLIKQRRQPSAASRLAPVLGQLRQLRTRMAQFAILNQSRSPTGLLLVSGRLENELNEAEECWFMVDNGCSSCCFTPEIIHALSLEADVGEKVRMQMANGAHIKSPQCLVPAITVGGSRAAFVKGIVLREATPGLDGSLGMSFLSRFDFTIQKAAPQRLDLRPPRAGALGGSFDVFICYKSEDAAYAHQVYTELTKHNYRPFFSDVSVEVMQATDYQHAINQAIEGARHLVLICSRESYVEEPWVRAEWLMFESLRRSGRKRGNIVPVLFGRVTPQKLPGALSMFHCVTATGSVEDWMAHLVSFLPR